MAKADFRYRAAACCLKWAARSRRSQSVRPPSTKLAKSSGRLEHCIPVRSRTIPKFDLFILLAQKTKTIKIWFGHDQSLAPSDVAQCRHHRHLPGWQRDNESSSFLSSLAPSRIGIGTPGHADSHE